MAIYDAFISYSHAKDKPIAAALQSVVQALGKPWYKRRAVRIFRDDTSLSATPHLWPTIEAALNELRFLILLASAEAARSIWVGKEVAYWLEHKAIDTLLIAVTDGELAWPPGATDFTWSDATPLPPVLKGRFPNEPKWVDLRAYRAGASKRDRKFTELSADFAAAVRGVAKEDLLSEEVRQQRRALTLAWSAIAVLLVLGGIAAWQWKAAFDAEHVAVQQRHVAEQQRDRATAAERTATEQKQIAEQQRDRATAAERTAVEQKQIAEQQRDRAERTLSAATGTANGLVSDLAVKFREVRGVPLTVVKGILGRGKGLLDDLLSFNETTPSVQLIRARTWTELGFTLAQQDDPEGARLVADAYQIAGTLAHDSPNLAGVDYARGRAAEVMAQLRERSDLKSAYDLNREAVESYAKCYAEHPTELPCLLQEFMTFGRLGNIFLSNKQFSDALTVYQKSSRIGAKLRAAGAARPGRRLLSRRPLQSPRPRLCRNAREQQCDAAVSSGPAGDGAVGRRRAGILHNAVRAGGHLQQYRHYAGSRGQFRPRQAARGDQLYATRRRHHGVVVGERSHQPLLLEQSRGGLRQP